MALPLTIALTVVWAGLNWPPPLWMLGGERSSGDGFVLHRHGGNLDPSEPAESWSRCYSNCGDAASESFWNTRPPRGVAEGFRRWPSRDAAVIRFGDVLGRLCRPIGLEGGTPLSVGWIL